MIERYTIKFGPAVSQRSLRRLYMKSNLTKMKARTEFIGDFEDVKKLSDILKELSKK